MEEQSQLSVSDVLRDSLRVFMVPSVYGLGLALFVIHFIINLLPSRWDDIIALFPLVFIWGALIKLVEQKHREKEEGVPYPEEALSEALDVAMDKCPSLFGATSIIILGLLMMVGSLTGLRLIMGPVVPIIILVIAGILVLIKLPFIYQAIVLDGEGATRSFKASWILTRGNEWQVFGLLLAILLLMLPFIIIEMLLKGAALLGGIFGAISTIWGTAAFTCAYIQLRGDPFAPPPWSD